MPWRRTSAGSFGSTCLARLLTLSVALSMSVPMLKVTWICTMPFAEEVEFM
jgi:hypothetical protein